MTKQILQILVIAVMVCAPLQVTASDNAGGGEVACAVKAPRVLCITPRGEELVVSAATIGDWAERFELVGGGTNYCLSHRVTLYRDGNMYRVNVCCPKGRAVVLHDGDVLKIHKAAIERRRCAGEENGHAECAEPCLVASLYDRGYWLANAEHMGLLSEEGYYFQIEEYEMRRKKRTGG